MAPDISRGYFLSIILGRLDQVSGYPILRILPLFLFCNLTKETLRWLVSSKFSYIISVALLFATIPIGCLQLFHFFLPIYVHSIECCCL